MATVVRNLTFRCKDLGKTTSILLAFDDKMDGIYKTYFPVVWKVSTFKDKGPYSMSVSYSNDLAFAKAQVANGNLISASTYSKLKPGQQTTLTMGDDSLFSFSEPVAGTPGLLKATNKTGLIQEIAVGFFNPLDTFKPFPALYFKQVGDNSHVMAKWKPVLRVYLESEYQESSVLVGAIDTDAIWSQDLHALSQNTVWDLTWDAATGHYTLTQGV
ncbi:hypothetical protein DEU56DRAFT_786802 [Suillus clintonianus]|uniref:uncharacterized protein n=1 Tax=Suillus clintonianus TaxID=1904413 RepID=UPI001B878D5A|nr:uncharacterized protein DEU56DRAFT_786802 [Suillus clintonianus]KAG2146200.1 hypothetical protein DEU56DRAFT_786802 [Suillus clintonianus]